MVIQMMSMQVIQVIQMMLMIGADYAKYSNDEDAKYSDDEDAKYSDDEEWYMCYRWCYWEVQMIMIHEGSYYYDYSLSLF